MSHPFHTLITQPVGFKEWSLVCEAMGQGKHHLILRKGGIHEGRQGFLFRHPDFFLFPTHFHAQADQVRAAAGLAIPMNPAVVEFRLACSILASGSILDLELLDVIRPFHIWRDEVLKERFGYGEQNGLFVALARAYRLPASWTVPNQPGFGGCRSWVNLPTVPDSIAAGAWNPAITDAEATDLTDQILSLIPGMMKRS